MIEQPSQAALLRGAFCAILLMAASYAHAEVALVVGANSSIDQVSKQQAIDVYTGKANALSGGGDIRLLDQPEASPLREEFYSKVVGKSASQAKAAWSKLAFTGRAIPPHEALSSDDIKRQLAGNPKLIGYIEKSAVDSSVKVIFTPE